MIGVIMLDTRFPRIAGDIGNPDSFPGPVIYRRVDRARVGDVVSAGPLPEALSSACVDAARELEVSGATVIGTSCGFLAPEQHRLQAAARCPVMSSSLLLIPFLRGVYGPDAGIGVLTFDADTLGVRHFNGSFDEHIIVQGLPAEGSLYRTIKNDEPHLDVRRAGREVDGTVRELLKRSPEVKVLLLECTNLSPFKPELRKKYRRPVFDLVDALIWLDNAAPAA